MNTTFRVLVAAGVLSLCATAELQAAAKAAGQLCIAPFHARRPPESPPGIPPPPVPPGEPSLSDTTWEPQYDSEFKFFINGRERATLHDGEMVYLTDLPTAKPIRVRVTLDKRPFESFSLDLSKYDHRICLWLYPGYWHWIDNGWDSKLGCRCAATPEPTPTPSKHGSIQANRADV